MFSWREKNTCINIKINKLIKSMSHHSLSLSLYIYIYIYIYIKVIINLIQFISTNSRYSITYQSVFIRGSLHFSTPVRLIRQSIYLSIFTESALLIILCPEVIQSILGERVFAFPKVMLFHSPDRLFDLHWEVDHKR